MDSATNIPTIQVFIPNALRARTGDHASVMVAGRTVREVIDTLDERFPGLRFNLCYETGDIRPFVNIFVNHENIHYLQGLDTPVSGGATLRILQSVAGG